MKINILNISNYIRGIGANNRVLCFVWLWGAVSPNVIMYKSHTVYTMQLLSVF